MPGYKTGTVSMKLKIKLTKKRKRFEFSSNVRNGGPVMAAG